jgi:hypothetical protein
MCKQLDLAPGGPEDDDGVPAFLAKAMSAPHSKSVTNALELLVDLGAMLPETNDLTTLGKCLSTISLHPRVGACVFFEMERSVVSPELQLNLTYLFTFFLIGKMVIWYVYIGRDGGRRISRVLELTPLSSFIPIGPIF